MVEGMVCRTSKKSADLIEELAAQDFPFDGQATALAVVQQVAELADYLPENLIFGSGVSGE